MNQPLYVFMGWAGPLTHRQFLAQRWYHEETRDQHDLIHYYLRLVCAEIRRSNPHLKHPNRVKDDHFTLRLERRAAEITTAETRQDKAERSRQTWAGIMGAFSRPGTAQPKQQE